jgi:hypothetical protein
MDRYRLTSINRPLDPNYPTNRLIILIGVVVLIISSLFHFSANNTASTSIIYGTKAGISIFLVWAISREVDPDREIAAFVPVILSLIPVMIYGMQPLLALYWLLLVLRIVNRSTGSKAGILDILTALLIGLYISYEVIWIVGILTAAAFFIDSRISAPERVHLLASIIMAVFTLFIISGGNNIAIADISLMRTLALISMILLFLPFIVSSEKPKSKGDRTREPLEAIRVKMGDILFLTTAISFIFVDTDYTASWPVLWCIAAGIGLYRLPVGERSVDLR